MHESDDATTLYEQGNIFAAAASLQNRDILVIETHREKVLLNEYSSLMQDIDMLHSNTFMMVKECSGDLNNHFLQSFQFMVDHQKMMYKVKAKIDSKAETVAATIMLFSEYNQWFKLARPVVAKRTSENPPRQIICFEVWKNFPWMPYNQYAYLEIAKFHDAQKTYIVIKDADREQISQYFGIKLSSIRSYFTLLRIGNILIEVMEESTHAEKTNVSMSISKHSTLHLVDYFYQHFILRSIFNFFQTLSAQAWINTSKDGFRTV